MPHYVVEKTADALNKFSKSLKGSKVLVMGIAYKKNIDDSRESPSIEIMDILIKNGCEVDYSDPHIPVFPVKRNYDIRLHSLEVSASMLNQYDCVILATDHDLFDYELIDKHARLIVDTRGRFRDSAVVHA